MQVGTFNRNTYIKTPKMPIEEASKLKMVLSLFEARPSTTSDETLKYCMDNLLAYFQSKHCGDFIYWHYRRRLIAEYSKRLNAPQ